jgi:hypothetical protein
MKFSMKGPKFYAHLQITPWGYVDEKALVIGWAKFIIQQKKAPKGAFFS